MYSLVGSDQAVLYFDKMQLNEGHLVMRGEWCVMYLNEWRKVIMVCALYRGGLAWDASLLSFSYELIDYRTCNADARGLLEHELYGGAVCVLSIEIFLFKILSE